MQQTLQEREKKQMKMIGQTEKGEIKTSHWHELTRG